jgi:hypothetical protein
MFGAAALRAQLKRIETDLAEGRGIDPAGLDPLRAVWQRTQAAFAALPSPPPDRS